MGRLHHKCLENLWMTRHVDNITLLLRPYKEEDIVILRVTEKEIGAFPETFYIKKLKKKEKPKKST